MTPGTPNFILLLVILIYTSPPIFIKFGPKLPKFALGVVFGVVGSRPLPGPGPGTAKIRFWAYPHDPPGHT